MLGSTSAERVALYAYEPAGHGDVRRLDGQARQLARRVCARTGRWPVATYTDRGNRTFRYDRGWPAWSTTPPTMPSTSWPSTPPNAWAIEYAVASAHGS